IGLSDSDSCKTLGVDRLHHATGVERSAKDLETALAKNFSKIDKLDSKRAIRFVAAEAIDGVAISQPVEWRFDIEVECGFENRRQHSLRDGENVVRRDERRFDVDLRKFRLPVGT